MTRVFSTLLLASSLVLVGCMSGPDRPGRGDRSGPPGGRQGSESASRDVVQPSAFLFVEFDLNRDHVTTRPEFEQGLKGAFEAADLNSDDVLSRPELSAWFVSALGSAYPVPGRIAFDPDGTQSTTLYEFENALTRQFDRVDADNDDQIARSELITTIQMGGRRGGGRGGQGGPSGGRPSGGGGGGGGRPPM